MEYFSGFVSPFALGYANFKNLMEIVAAFPDQIPPDVVIENSDLANKENIIDKLVAVEKAISDQQSAISEKI